MSEDITNMKDPLFLDKSFNGLSDEIFDDVLKFFDFPLEDVDPNIPEDEDWDAQFKRIEAPSFDVFSVSSSQLCSKTQNDNLHLGRRTFSSGKQIPASVVKSNIYLKNKDQPQFRTHSPDSVFESTTSSSGESPNFDLPMIPGKRPRGNRRRLSSFASLLPILLTSKSPALRKSQKEAATGQRKRKQRKKDVSILSSEVKMKKSSLGDSGVPRKCMHCETTKTPQWREGPMGPKTLCNACGVRYRSGRLFPEYRPAASPTFIPSLHSNSHKKVIEMRNSVMHESEASILGLSPI